MRHFKVTEWHNWKFFIVGYFKGDNHKEVANLLAQSNKRIYNERYREIETTGDYYQIEDVQKGGKIFIFEIIK